MADTGTPSITAAFSADHARLDKVWERCVSAIRSSEPELIRSNFSEFETGLRRHIRAEDEVLFPAFERAAGMVNSGPTAVMRAEHREIEALLDRLAKLVNAGDCTALLQTVERGEGPSALLRNHDAKEENVLYPMADRIIGADQSRVAVAALHSSRGPQ